MDPPPPSIFSIFSKCLRAFFTLTRVTADAIIKRNKNVKLRKIIESKINNNNNWHQVYITRVPMVLHHNEDTTIITCINHVCCKAF